jgi:hypothetical protein
VDHRLDRRVAAWWTSCIMAHESMKGGGQYFAEDTACAEIGQALGHPIRLEILRLLANCGERCPAAATGASPPRGFLRGPPRCEAENSVQYVVRHGTAIPGPSLLHHDFGIHKDR